MVDTWTDEELIGYIETHSKTELGLTHSDHIKRLMKLAGHSDELLEISYPTGSNRFFNIAYVDVKDVIAEARENIRKKGPRKMEEQTIPGNDIEIITAKSPRISWDAYFMKIATTVSMRSTCPRKHVGALIVRDRQILSTGYNGSPRGLPHCDDEGCFLVNMGGRASCVRTIHAEANAIVQAARNGVRIGGATLYTTAYPCPDCGRAIINAGIEAVVYGSKYDSRAAMGPSSEEMFKAAHVQMLELKVE